MRHRWIHSLALSLGILVLGCLAGFLPTALPAAEPGPIIQPYPPLPARSEPAEPAAKPALERVPEPAAADSLPATTLDRPVALPAKSDAGNSEVQPTGLFRNRDSDPVLPSASPNLAPASPLPPVATDTPTLPMPSAATSTPPPPDVPYTWRPPSPASPGAPSTTIAPPPAGSAVPPPGSLGGPLGNACTGDGCCAPGCAGLDCGDGWAGCCGGGRGCCFGNRWYGSAEYLLWFIRGQPLPPLLTTGPATDNPPGALGQPNTQVLFGNGNLNTNPYSGLRLRAGWWLDNCHSWGIDLGGFFLGGNANRFSASSFGNPFLSRPFFNPLTGTEDIEAVATPNGLTGTFSAVNTFVLYGAEANLRRNLLCGCNWYIDGFIGWRLLGLNETLKVQENLAVAASTNPALPAGSTFIVTDKFGTTNLFNGGQIGAIAEYRLGRWFVDLRTSVGVGGTMQHVTIDGSTVSQVPGSGPTVSQGGLLAQSSNIGSYTRGITSFIEEVGLNVGYQFTNHIRGFVGYNFLYWNNVVRPGNQIDQTVNPNLIPPSVPGGPARPAFDFRSSDFWAQGVTFGLDIRW
ncbi:MAG TPA: BBP7 family outer membrane beta-barrel protein [Gemmataceae bacterium]|jgi:hypothetical protein